MVPTDRGHSWLSAHEAECAVGGWVTSSVLGLVVSSTRGMCLAPDVGDLCRVGR